MPPSPDWSQPSDDGAHHQWRFVNHKLLPSCWESLVDLSPTATSVVGPLAYPIPGDHPAELPTGFRLNFDLMASPSIGDYLPPGPTLEQSSVALVPGSAAAASTGWQGQTRPTLDGQVDLITGLPLARVVDLELPFGGATFRLTRTRSAHETLIHGVRSGAGARVGSMDGFHEHERWWDWVGQGWMAGENPFLILDSALPDVVGPNPRTTYLVLDAHHSIPFQRVLLNGGGEVGYKVGYEAPPRFRARMEHDGVWGPINGPAGPNTLGWVKAPTQYDVWLYDGALRYTFVAIRDDVPVNVWDPRYASTAPPVGGHDPSTAAWAHGSLHDYQLSGQFWTQAYGNARHTPGFGIPHYAICVRIRDKHGNAVEIEYCNVERTDGADSDATDDCIECQELCLRKGQIKAIRLTSPSGSGRQVHWTLLYVHRLFAGDSVYDPADGSLHPAGDPETTPALRGNIAIDRIYVYPGNPQDAANVGCLTIGPSGDPYRDDLGDFNPTQALGAFHNGWQHQVRYFYRPHSWTMGTLPLPNGLDDPYKPTRTPVLAMTEVSSRVRTGASQTTWGPSSTRLTFFRYSPTNTAVDHGAWHWLERIYTDREYGALREWARENPPGDDPLSELRLRVGAISKPLDFAFADLGDGSPGALSLVESSLNDVGRAHLHKFAAVSMLPWVTHSTELRCPNDPRGSSHEAPFLSYFVDGFNSPGSPSTSHVYISALAGSPERNAVISEPGKFAVRVASVRNSAGQPRHVRLFHFIVTPRSDALASFNYTTQCGVNQDWWHLQPGGSQVIPNRSVRFHPYRWFASPFTWDSGYPLQWPPQDTPNAGTLWTEAADLSQPRWIRVIDEFGTPEERDSVADDARYGSTAPFIKPGQLSRRVVTMNAAGYVLTDRVWTFSETEAGVGILASGTGLGEEWIYSSVQTEFQSVVGTPPAPDPDVGRLGAASQDPYHAVRNEMILVEHRSVGWSATPHLQQHNAGLVRGFKYDLVPATANQKPAVRLFSEWVQSGSSSSLPAPVKRYTRHLFYHENPLEAAPTDIASQVIPLTNDAADDLRTPGLVTAALSNPSAFALTRWVIKRHNNTGKPIAERPIVEYRQIDAPRRLRPGSATLYFPVQVELYDPATGYPTWKATGLLTTPENMSAGSGQPDEALIWSYTLHDGLGRVLEEVVDAQPGASLQSKRPGGSSFPVPSLSGFGRISSDPALNLVTSHAGHDDDGPTDIYFSNGRRWARRTVILQPVPAAGGDPDQYREEPEEPANLNDNPSPFSWAPRAVGSQPVRRDFIFSDLERSTSNPEQWIARTPGLVLDYAQASRHVEKFRPHHGPLGGLGGITAVMARSVMGPLVTQLSPPLKPVRSRRVVFVESTPGSSFQPAVFTEGSGFLGSPSQSTQPYFRSLSRIELRPDEYGQLSQASHFERDSLGMMVPSGQVRVNDLGEMYRAMAMDGGITRLIKNSLGHVLRKYEGTVDQTWLQLAGGTLSSPPSATASPAGEHNMVLTERIEYGAGTNNAWLPTVVRRYTTNSFPTGWHLSPFDLPPGQNEDVHGQATVTKYDWRMRPVREDIHAAGVPTDINRLLTTFTYLNHAGQARLVATYGANSQNLALPASLDPSGFAPGADTPPLAQFFASGALRPLALVETIYAPDGSVEETRTYDVAWNGSGSPPYTAEREHSGFGGSTVFRHGPGEEAEISRVDALGRVTWTASVAPRSSGTAAFSYQLSRTDYTYDVDGNVIRTDQWERILDSFSPTTAGPGDVLSSINAVRSTTLNWYDTQRRLVASADYGTGTGPGGTFTTDPANIEAQVPEATLNNRPTLNAMNGTVDRSGIPATIPISINHYNIKGELAFVVTQQSGSATQAPVYSITGYTYTGTGKTATVTENPFTELAEQRTTMYHYQYGRLSGITAGTLPLAPPSTDDQHSSIASGATSDNAWGALVIDTGADGSAFTPISRSASLASSFSLPGNAAGATFAYDFLGRLVERTDARGVVMRYRYDDLDRLRSITVGHYLGGVFQPGYADSWRLPNQNHPVDMVAFVQYDYNANHRLTDARAYGSATPANLIAHTRFNYDARGNLIDDIQGIGAEATGVTPRTSYAWNTTFASGNRVGRTRLTSVSYPHQTSMPIVPPRRIVTVGYGTSGQPSDILSRIATFASSPVVAPDPSNIATFTHTGGFRRARTVLAGGAITADMGLDTSTTDGTTGIGIRGLDGLGRLIDLHYRRSGSGDQTTITRLQTTLDLAGSRLSTRRTPHPLSSHAWLQHDSTYDPFQRLTGSTFNNSNSNNSSLFRGEAWTLDVFGNWLNVTTSVTGAAPIQTTSEIGFGNRYIQRTRGSGQPVDTSYPIYDRAGNLAFDGTYCYQYDAWNRLVQVNRATRTNFVPFPLPTEDPLQAIIPGPLVKHFTHDALGRLVRVQSPFPEPAPGETGLLRTERLFYDGVRRIQEVIIDPAVSLDGALAGEGGAALQGEAQLIASNAAEELDGAATPAMLESVQLGEGDGGGASQMNGTSMTPGTTTMLAREYVWGPGDWGVDELLVQYDAARRATWPILDSGGDVIALCDLGNPNNSARILTRIVYDAYGRVIGRSDPATPATGPPELRVGHKGLFFDRLDWGIVDPLTLEETPRLEPGATLLGYNRNRTLHVGWGRFLQRDPNATGLPVQSDLGYHGEALSGVVQAFNLGIHYGDGANVYEYIRSDPLGGGDPTGLEGYLSINITTASQGVIYSAQWGQYASIGASYGAGTSASAAAVGFGVPGLGGGVTGTLVGWKAGVAALAGVGIVAGPQTAMFFSNGMGRETEISVPGENLLEHEQVSLSGRLLTDEERRIAAAERAYPNKAGRTEEHHVWPKYLGGPIDGPTIPINAAYHQQITNAFRAEWGYGNGRPSAAEAHAIMARVYARYPLPPPK
jgi:YD repeat-containing protein